MLIDDFHFIGITATPNEADSPLLVDSDRMLTLSYAAQSLQMIPWRRSKNTQMRSSMSFEQFSHGDPLEGSEAPAVMDVKKLLRFLRAKALNHILKGTTCRVARPALHRGGWARFPG